jgi:hypothetical protein
MSHEPCHIDLVQCLVGLSSSVVFVFVFGMLDSGAGYDFLTVTLNGQKLPPLRALRSSLYIPRSCLRILLILLMNCDLLRRQQASCDASGYLSYLRPMIPTFSITWVFSPFPASPPSLFISASFLLFYRIGFI